MSTVVATPYMPVRHGKTQTGYSIDVFHQRNLRKILGITWKDKITNEEVLQRTGQRRLQDIVAERRFRFAGHIIRLPQERPAHCTIGHPGGDWRKRGRPKKTWWTTFKEDLQLRAISWCEVEAAAAERTRRRYIAAHCPAKNRRN